MSESESVPADAVIIAESKQKIQGDALAKMRALVLVQEPMLINLLDVTSSRSFEYATLSTLRHVQSKQLKADLVRILVQQELDQGFPAAALETLERADATELDLPEFDERFVSEQYNRAIEEKKYAVAHKVAKIMLERGRKIIPTDQTQKTDQGTNLERWRGREEQAFELHVRQVLDAYDNGTEMDKRPILLYELFDEFRFRPDGYRNAQQGGYDYQNPLVREVALKAIAAAVQQGQEVRALEYADTAKLGKDFIAALRKKFPSQRRDWRGFVTKMKSYLSR